MIQYPQTLIVDLGVWVDVDESFQYRIAPSLISANIIMFSFLEEAGYFS